MKNWIKIGVLALSSIVTGCTSDMDYNAGQVSSVAELYAPANHYYLELASGSNQATTFSWSPANVSDGYSPMYEVVFYKDAAATQEISRISAGVSSSISLAHKVINKIMNATGTEPEAIGKLYWTVTASRAVTESILKPIVREMDVKRLKGFKINPDALYITGSATEGGVNIGDALAMTNVSDGEIFEIFTHLGSGNFNITDGSTASARRFTITNGLIREEDSTPINSSYNGIYRIRIDLSTSSATIDEVKNMRWVMCIQKNDLRPLVYQGNGVWRGENLASNFDSGWKDDRYFFRAEIGGATVKIGNNKSDFGGAPSNKASLTWNVYFAPEGNPDWDYSYKVIAFYRGSIGLNTNITLCLNASTGNYYHTIEFPDFE